MAVRSLLHYALEVQPPLRLHSPGHIRDPWG